VEVYQAGAWWAGELLGWRHEEDGSCSMCVRVVLGGREETAWIGLAGLRLPEPGGLSAPAVVAGRDLGATQKLPRTSASRRGRAGAVAGTATAGRPAVRDPRVAATVAVAAVHPGGRRRAPEQPDPSATPAQPVQQGGRRRAPELHEARGAGAAVPAPRSGGRRRAPEDDGAPDLPTDTAAALPADLAPDLVLAAGRHRATAAVGAGRHRTADTGMLAAAPAVPRPSLPAARREGAPHAPARASWPGSADPEPELLTRPMRLSDSIPLARRGRRDGTLSTA
jgi:hypothetical protein